MRRSISSSPGRTARVRVEPDAASPDKTITGSPEGVSSRGSVDLTNPRQRKSRGGHVGDMESIRLINRLLELGILEKV